MITQKNPVGRYAVEINSTATAAESPIHNPKFAPPVTSYSLPATAAAPPILLPANPVLLSKMLSESKIQCTMMRDFYAKSDSQIVKYQQLIPEKFYEIASCKPFTP